MYYTTLLVLLSSAVLGACDIPPLPEVQDDLLMVATWRTDPLQVGQNTLDIRVTDGDGVPVVDTLINVDPQMPIYGHGSSETPAHCEATEDTGTGCAPSAGCLQEEGCYTFFPVTFTVAGSWIITIQALWVADALHYSKLVLDVNVPTSD